MKVPLWPRAFVAVSLLCTDVSSRPVVLAVGKDAGCDCCGCPASKGPCCLSPFPPQDLAPGLSLAGSRRQVSSQSCSTQRARNEARNFHHLETELGTGLGPWGWLQEEQHKRADRTAHRPQPLTPHRLQAGCPGRVPAWRILVGPLLGSFSLGPSMADGERGLLGVPL